ncbi:hypothetical protein [Citricoccus muralis]|uniref:Uncharacterized protein n=1 Tax=Citricoccus muralis TaxID=169134 RepID=A0ABY8H6Z4_9MICC|nr:hypothetical protein [Citricoccus muralis]WFP16428.1 hypothetical protein P8192_13775 [Citricoccus muralis]
MRRILEVEATRVGVSHIRNQELESVGHEIRRMEAALNRDVERAVAATEASLDAAIERIRSAFAQE